MSLQTHTIEPKQQLNLIQKESNEDIDELLYAITSFPMSESQPRRTTASSKGLPYISSKNLTSRHAQRLAKNRERMRKRRKFQKAEKSILNARIEVLTEQLHQLLAISKINTSPDVQIVQNPQKVLNTISNLPQELRKEYLMRSYMQLIAMAEHIRQENEVYEQRLDKEWGRYINFVGNQLQKYYHSNPLTGTLSVQNSMPKYVSLCQPAHPQIKNTAVQDGQWVSFSHNSPMKGDENNKHILLFRESTDDVYFRRINNLMCKKLQVEAYEEGISFTQVMQQEIKCGARLITKESDYFGWKLIYYQITTKEAYPHLTSVTNLETSDVKLNVDDMVRFDFTKRYQLKPHQNFDTVFTIIRERCWKMMISPIPLAGLHFSLKTMVGCVLQTINDQSFIVIRSFIGKSSQTIHRMVFLMHQYEHGVLASLLNPFHCIDRMGGGGKERFNETDTSKCGGDDIFWETHGHGRFSWCKVGQREFEIRYGGTYLLGEYSLNNKIGELGELLFGWEQNIFDITTDSPPDNQIGSHWKPLI